MDTTNSSENQQRRVEDRKPNETINWEAPDAPAVPLSPDAAERADPPVRYVASLLVNSEGASVFTTPDAARLPHGHYLLSAGAYSIAPGHAGRVERTPTGAYSQYVASCQDRGVLPCSRESFEADTSGDAPTAYMYQDDADVLVPGTGSCFISRARMSGYKNETPLYARIERAAAPAPSAVVVPEGWQPVYLVWSDRALGWVDAGFAEYDDAEPQDRRIAYEPKKG